MGAHVHRFAAGQRPDLTATKPRVGQIDDAGATDPSIRIVILALLAVDGILSAVAALRGGSCSRVVEVRSR